MSNDSGQAMVETAITMPLFVFIMLGTLQLGLMHQAHSLTKYAAYKAVRAGSLNHAKIEVMERAAAAVLTPMIAWQQDGIDKVMPVSDAASYVQKVQMARMLVGPFKPASVKICGPTKATGRRNPGIASSAQKAGNEIQFDAPWDPGTDWQSSESTKLRIEVTFHYHLPIPFANMMLYWIARGQEDAEVLFVTKTGSKQTHYKAEPADDRSMYDAMARAHQGYVLPIRATYTMKMMSDLYPDKSGMELPDEDSCTIPFARKG